MGTVSPAVTRIPSVAVPPVGPEAKAQRAGPDKTPDEPRVMCHGLRESRNACQDAHSYPPPKGSEISPVSQAPCPHARGEKRREKLAPPPMPSSNTVHHRDRDDTMVINVDCQRGRT